MYGVAGAGNVSKKSEIDKIFYIKLERDLVYDYYNSLVNDLEVEDIKKEFDSKNKFSDVCDL